MPNPTVSYVPRPGTTPQAEISALAGIYKLVIDCRANRNAAGVTSTNGGDAKEGRSLNDSSAKTRIP